MPVYTESGTRTVLVIYVFMYFTNGQIALFYVNNYDKNNYVVDEQRVSSQIHNNSTIYLIV